jgi:triosephosphate isomerase
MAGNWKMNLTPDEGVTLAKSLAELVKNVKNVEIVVCPTFVGLASVGEAIKGTNVFLGAQNVYPKDNGAYTGEISPGMLKAVGCRYVIIGHSERREYFNETDAFVNAKIKAALAAALIPIVCVGESLAQREADKTFEIVGNQIKGAFDGISAAEAAGMIIAYEPIWAIGTGKTASPQQAQDVHAFIRSQLAERFDHGTAENIRIQYGGSVKADNVDELMAKPDIDGALVGGASLKADGFARIAGFTR